MHDAPPTTIPVLPPATIRSVGVVTAAGLIRFTGIGGRRFSHFIALPDKQKRVLYSDNNNFIASAMEVSLLLINLALPMKAFVLT